MQGVQPVDVDRDKNGIPVKSDDPVSPKQIDKYFTVPDCSFAFSIIFSLFKIKTNIILKYLKHNGPLLSPAAQTLAYSVRSSLANDDALLQTLSRFQCSSATTPLPPAVHIRVSIEASVHRGTRQRTPTFPKPQSHPALEQQSRG
jgi:hypothetical protein